MATHSSALAWRIPGTVEPGGLPSMGSHRIGYDWSDLAAAAAAMTDGVERLFISLFAIHISSLVQCLVKYCACLKNLVKIWLLLLSLFVRYMFTNISYQALLHFYFVTVPFEEQIKFFWWHLIYWYFSLIMCDLLHIL